MAEEETFDSFAEEQQQKQPEIEDGADPFASAAESLGDQQAPAEDLLLPVDEKEPVVEAKAETPLSRWEVEREKTLRGRAEKADADKAEALIKAKEEIKKFYDERNSKVDNNKKRNRQDEKNEKRDMSELMAGGTRWQKVNKLVDTKPKKDHQENQRTDRQRLLISKLKTEKDPDETDHKAKSQ